MNKNQNPSHRAPLQGKPNTSRFWPLRKLAALKGFVFFESSPINQEKLPIVYANIRV
ncbi:hypothetical protein SAMN02927903_00669 [Flavobacterium caeni]|uniref:Uncharacterized protein n=1 Tax=Flavobacterium caeni TaxID=490189 RepID=A0A1G5CXK1_9FLAO|nr:hypothetical protein SAMN02927903_00669 [Flavobacterium caeni]